MIELTPGQKAVLEELVDDYIVAEFNMMNFLTKGEVVAAVNFMQTYLETLIPEDYLNEDDGE